MAVLTSGWVNHAFVIRNQLSRCRFPLPSHLSGSGLGSHARHLTEGHMPWRHFRPTQSS
jgi:hypothetical protein